MAKHTEGPWNVLLHSEGDTVLNVIAGEATYKGSITQAKWVAEMDADSLEGEYGENEANARLIASSPDLLAACLALIGAASCQSMNRVYEATDMARKAVEKATGEAPP